MSPLYDVIHAEQYALEIIWKSLRFADHVTKRNVDSAGEENESAYEVKNNCCSFERLFKVKRNDVSMEFEIAGFSFSCERKPF